MAEFFNEKRLTDNKTTIRIYAGGHAFLDYTGKSGLPASIQVGFENLIGSLKGQDMPPSPTDRQRAFYDKCRAFLVKANAEWESLNEQECK